MDLGLKDRAAIVAASSQGLGKAVAMVPAREGAKLALCARTGHVRTATANQIHGATGADVIRWAAQTPFSRIGTLGEFANVVGFLASERAGYVTGVSRAVDGGIVKGVV